MEQIKVTPDMQAEIRGSWQEIDREQMAVIHAMSCAQRAQICFDLIESLMQAAIYRLQQQQPDLTAIEARRLINERYYEQNPSTYLPR